MIRWPAEAIWQAVYPLLPEFSVEILPQIDSTNTELMRRARAGRLEPVLLVTERQTAGRGRLGRSWESANPPAPAISVAPATHGASAVLPALTFSLGLPLAPTDWSGLSLAVGAAVAEALHPDIGLKWPNDLWWQDRKLAGILIETASFGEQRYAVIGVGINIGARPGDGLSTAPAWLGAAGATGPCGGSPWARWRRRWCVPSRRLNALVLSRSRPVSVPATSCATVQ